MARVFPAEPADMFRMGSLGNASYMLIRQHQFPDKYDERRDVHVHADHDHIIQQGYERAQACFKKHLKTGEGGLAEWVRRRSPEEVIAFINEFLTPHFGDRAKAAVWTGFRVSGTVHRGNGFPVWSIELFAKHPETKTKVYDGENAPNVLAEPCPSGSREYKPRMNDPRPRNTFF